MSSDADPQSDYDVAIFSPNLAIDSYYVLSDFEVGNVNRAQAAWHSAGGKGCNMSRALRTLGGQAVVIGCVAGQEGRFIEAELQRENVAHELVWFEGETRRCSTLVVPSQRETTVVLAPGNPIGARVYDQLIERFVLYAQRSRFSTLIGSLPPDLPVTTYASVNQILRRIPGIKVCLDSTGEVLRLAAETGPYLVKVNLSEFQLAFGACGESPWACIWPVFYRLKSLGVEILIVTDGPRGAYVIDRDECSFQVRTQVDSWISTVGSGDTFLAGLLLALGRGQSLEQAARFASATAAANLQQIGCGYLNPEDVSRFLDNTMIIPAEAFRDR